MKSMIAITIAGVSALTLIGVTVARSADRDGTWQPGVPASQVKGQPTGYQIRGCAHHETVGTVVRQVCNERNAQEYFPRAQARGDLSAPSN